MGLPASIFVSVSLFTAETAAALCLGAAYRSAGEPIWQVLTLLFAAVSSALVQLTLIFIHRDLIGDRPLLALLHLLQLGPIVRCLEAFCIYGSLGKVEEPYVSITRLKQMAQGGPSEEVERQVGQAEGKLVVHQAAFSRASVVQAFLGSAPQLTLQLYICVLQGSVSAGRGALMAVSLLSVVYGALHCNILAIKITYNAYEVEVRPAAYLCIVLWRTFEIATRVAVLVLFSSVLRAWVVPVVLLNFLAFSCYPWVLFWRSRCPFPEDIEKTLTRVGTTTVLGLLTFLYAGINMFCWSAVQLQLSDPDLINKSQNWVCLATYYVVRFLENAGLLLLWHGFRTEVYRLVCSPLLLLQLLAGYAVAVSFMLVFHRFCHPCRKLFSSSDSWATWGSPRILCPPCAPCPYAEPAQRRPGSSENDDSHDSAREMNGAARDSLGRLRRPLEDL